MAGLIERIPPQLERSQEGREEPPKGALYPYGGPLSPSGAKTATATVVAEDVRGGELPVRTLRRGVVQKRD